MCEIESKTTVTIVVESEEFLAKIGNFLVEIGVKTTTVTREFEVTP